MLKKPMKFIDHIDSKDGQTCEAHMKMDEQIKKVGGELHFEMKTDEEGWFSVCKEFPAIVTGGSNRNPSDEEVFKSTIESIKTAFDVPITQVSFVREERKPIKISTTMTKEFSLA